MAVRQFTEGKLAGRWQLDYYGPNKRGKKSRRVRLTLPAFVKTLEQAQKYEAELLAGRKESPDVPAGSTIEELSESFFEYLKHHKSPRTYKDIKQTFERHVLKHIGKVHIYDISPGHFELFKTTRKNEEGPNREINKEVVYIRSFFKWAASIRLCDPLSFKVERLPYTAPTPHVLTRDEITRMCEAADLQHRCILLCLYQAGLRLQEALSLTWEDVFWNQHALLVKKGKGNKSRVVPMGEWLAESLRELKARAVLFVKPKGEVFQTAKDCGLDFKYSKQKSEMIDAILAVKPVDLQTEEATGFIFINHKTGKPLTSIRKTLKAAADSAGIKQRVHPHLLRHSVATQMIADGTDIRKLQGFLGHTDISMTQKYTHLAIEMLRGDVVQLGRSTNPA
jgi:integrase/recombinase XerD